MAKASKEETLKLALLSSDCSSLLSHLVRQNSDSTRADHQALAVLKAILGIDSADKRAEPLLKGGVPDWFSMNEPPKIFQPAKSKFIAPTAVKGVCFTESTLVGLRAHRDIFKVKYGLAFDREYLYLRGANPCLNIREELLNYLLESDYKFKKLQHYIPDPLIGYINIINETFDPTYEREWRILGDLKFNFQDIKFIFCPQKDFPLFSIVQKNGMPCLFDLEWLNKI